MRFYSVKIAPIFFLILSACSNVNSPSVVTIQPTFTATITSTSTPTVTSTSTLTPTSTATPSPTLTFTPTPIPPTPTMTPIPEVLDQLPLTFADADTSVVAGLGVFQVTDVYGLSSIGSTSIAPTQQQYLTIEGYIYNYSDTDIVFYNSDFKATFLDTYSTKLSNVEPSVELMRLLKDEKYPDRDWPAQNWRVDRKFTVTAKHARSIFLVYQVPTHITVMSLQFTPSNFDPPPALGIWFHKSANGSDVFFKVSSNDKPIYKYEFLPETVTEISEIVDSRTESLDNCFGNSEIERETGLDRTISLEIKTQIDPGDLANVLEFIPEFQPFGKIAGKLVSSYYNRNDGDVMTFTDATRLRAASGTHTVYRVTYYKVNLAGKIRIYIGDKSFDVPYTIGDRLRTDVVSLPPIPCGTTRP